MPCSARTCSASSSTPAARRSPRSPWPWPRGRTPDPTGSRLGYRPLPTLNIACSGQGVVGTKEDWAKFANGDGTVPRGDGAALRPVPAVPRTSARCIDPRTVTEDLFALGFDTLKGTVERALKKIEARDDPDRAALGVAAQGIALAASLMSREFTLGRDECAVPWHAASKTTLRGLLEKTIIRRRRPTWRRRSSSVAWTIADRRNDRTRYAAELAIPRHHTRHFGRGCCGT